MRRLTLIVSVALGLGPSTAQCSTAVTDPATVAELQHMLKERGFNCPLVASVAKLDLNERGQPFLVGCMNPPLDLYPRLLYRVTVPQHGPAVIEPVTN